MSFENSLNKPNHFEEADNKKELFKRTEELKKQISAKLIEIKELIETRVESADKLYVHYETINSLLGKIERNELGSLYELISTFELEIEYDFTPNSDLNKNIRNVRSGLSNLKKDFDKCLDDMADYFYKNRSGPFEEPNKKELFKRTEELKKQISAKLIETKELIKFAYRRKHDNTEIENFLQQYGSNAGAESIDKLYVHYKGTNSLLGKIERNELGSLYEAINNFEIEMEYDPTTSFDLKEELRDIILDLPNLKEDFDKCLDDMAKYFYKN